MLIIQRSSRDNANHMQSKLVDRVGGGDNV